MARCKSILDDRDKNISFRPLRHLTEDELKEHLGRKLADLSKLSQGSLEEKLGTAAYRPYVNSIAEDIQQIEAEQRYRREMRMQESMVTVSEAMLEVNRSTLKVYRLIAWLTLALILVTIGQLVVAVLLRK